MGERGWSDDVKIGLGCGDGSVMVRCGEKKVDLIDSGTRRERCGAASHVFYSRITKPALLRYARPILRNYY
jgi:hypothetical protein